VRSGEKAAAGRVPQSRPSVKGGEISMAKKKAAKKKKK
jgi:hypothetical protein